VSKRISNLQINIADDGARQAAYEAAAEKAGHPNKSQWAVRILDAALGKRVQKKLPPLTGMGRPPAKK